MRSIFIACLVLGLVSASAHAALYKWIDEEGNVHFSDQPPPTYIKNFETGRAARGQTDDATADLPYVLKEPVKNFPVTLYSSPCGAPCDQARQLLKKRGIPYTEKDASDAAVQTDMSKLLGGDGVVVPILTVGRTLQRGFEEGAWNNALDNAGYPKTSVLPQKAANPKPVKPGAPGAKPADTSGKSDKDADVPAKKSAGQYPVNP